MRERFAVEIRIKGVDGLIIKIYVIISFIYDIKQRVEFYSCLFSKEFIFY